MVKAEADEDVQGGSPVLAGLLVLTKRVMGVGEPVVGTGLVVGLTREPKYSGGVSLDHANPPRRPR